MDLFAEHFQLLGPWMSPGEYESILNDTQCQAAFAVAHTHLPPAILNHCVRVYCYAQRTAIKSFPDWQCAFRDCSNMPSCKIIFLASILHDIGASDTCETGHKPQRFEVEGADAAVALMQSHGNSTKEELSSVWEAIALHTSPGIAERISPMALCLRIGVKIDFGSPGKYETDPAELRDLQTAVEGSFPRLEIEKVLGNAVLAQAIVNPDKAPKSSWPWCLLVAYQENPHYEGVNPGF